MRKIKEKKKTFKIENMKSRKNDKKNSSDDEQDH